MKKLPPLAALGTVALAALARTGAFTALFSANYLPHRYCYLAQPGLVWTNVVMDSLIAASYAIIFGCLFWIASRLRGLAAMSSYLWIFIAFGTFIVACGATHLMEVVTIWWPVYPLSATVKIICAAASVPTAILFARVSPALAANIRRFLEMLSTTQQEKDQAILSLIASEKLAAAGRISATISHEIKNPLQSIGDALYVLAQDDRTPSDLAKIIQSARSELAHATAIADDTLGLFQGSSAPTSLSLASVTQGVLDLQAAHLLKRGIALEPRLRTPLPLRANASDLRQILINLIQNACAAIDQMDKDRTNQPDHKSVKGSRAPRRILVRVQPRSSLAATAAKLQLHTSGFHRETTSGSQRGYSITVADSGPGIPLSHRKQLFTLFFTTKGDQGTGLGLWLVRSMVEKQGGRIVFRSRTASESRFAGTVFNVWLPLEPAPSLSISAPGDPGSGASNLPSTAQSQSFSGLTNG